MFQWEAHKLFVKYVPDNICLDHMACLVLGSYDLVYYCWVGNLRDLSSKRFFQYANNMYFELEKDHHENDAFKNYVSSLF